MKPQARVGIHQGQTMLVESADAGATIIASLAADLCARVMGLGEGGQVLLTRSVFDDGRQPFDNAGGIGGIIITGDLLRNGRSAAIEEPGLVLGTIGV